MARCVLLVACALLDSKFKNAATRNNLINHAAIYSDKLRLAILMGTQRVVFVGTDRGV